MNIKALSFFKNTSYNMLANLVTLLVSAVGTLVIPKILGSVDFGYWQLYLFYLPYVIIFQMGLNEGLYLRYGGADYEELDKPLFHHQLLFLLIFQVFIAMIAFGYSMTLTGPNEIFIAQMLSLEIVFMNIRSYFNHLLDATNRFKYSATITIIDRLMFLFIITLLFLNGVGNYEPIIYANITAKIISIGYAIWICRDIAFNNLDNFSQVIKESITNIKVGLNLLLSNISGNLIVGVVRLGIERNWGVATFGQISLTLNISNFLMTFINGIGSVIYPVLRRTAENKLSSIYKNIKNSINFLSFAVLFLYYPFKFILSIWLPEYQEALNYMAILFPMVVYEGKLSLLINTYLKSMRKEKVMLRINIFSLLLSFILTVIAADIVQNFNLTVVNILIVQIIRATISELYLKRIFHFKLLKDFVLELCLIFIFIISGWFVGSWAGMLIYGMSYLLYLYIKKENIRQVGEFLKENISKK